MHGEVLEGKEREGGNVNFYGFIMITFSKLLFFFKILSLYSVRWSMT